MKSRIVVLISTLIAWLGACASPASTDVPPAASGLARSVSVAEAAKLRETGALVIDVREQAEWDEFHMPDATLIPLGTLDGKVAELPKDEPIVLVCRSGSRSATARDRLLKAGFTNVTSMNGGMLAWQDAGLPIAK
jgi:rhodanese-related sulfurtransferase